jgi:hypothetical protein
VFPLPEAGIVQETKRILDTAERHKVVLRLLGGMAMRLRCPSATHRLLARRYADIDFMGLKKHGRDIRKLFNPAGGSSSHEVPSRRDN